MHLKDNTIDEALRIHRRALRKMQKEKKRLIDEYDEIEKRKYTITITVHGLYEAMRHTRAHIRELEITQREEPEA